MTNNISADAAHKSWWQTFEVVFGIPFFIAIALQLTLPLALPSGSLTPAIVLGGAAFIIVGIGLVVLARREFTHYNQSTEPGHATSKIVTTGVFSISRNPLYLGGVCVLAGIALALNLPWVLILLLPSLVVCHYILIAPEEKYLAGKFGEEYGRYCAAVHRWLGHI